MEQELHCQECGDELHVEEFIEAGDVVTCNECGAEYLVKKILPLRIVLLVNDEEVEPRCL